MKSTKNLNFVISGRDLASLVQFRVASFSQIRSGVGYKVFVVPVAHPYPTIPQVNSPGEELVLDYDNLAVSSHNAPHKRLLRTNHIPFPTYSQSDFTFHFSGSDLLYTHRMVTPPITTLLLSVLHFGMTKQSNWIVDSLCGDVSYFLCCFFFPFL